MALAKPKRIQRICFDFRHNYIFKAFGIIFKTYLYRKIEKKNTRDKYLDRNE